MSFTHSRPCVRLRLVRVWVPAFPHPPRPWAAEKTYDVHTVCIDHGHSGSKLNDVVDISSSMSVKKSFRPLRTLRQFCLVIFSQHFDIFSMRFPVGGFTKIG